MSQNNHTAPDKSDGEDPLVQAVYRIPNSLKWELVELAGKKRTKNVSALVTSMLSEGVAREKAVA